MDGLTVKYNELTADEFTEIWQSVWGDAPDSRQTALAMEHTGYRSMTATSLLPWQGFLATWGLITT